VTSLLFLAIFLLALGGRVEPAQGVDLARFLAPGLVMMTMLQNAFANTSSSLMIAKMQGNIVDVLMPPLSAGELTAAYVIGGVARGLVVGVATGLAIWPFAPFGIVSPALVLYHAVSASLMLSLLGIMTGVWAEKFDHIAAATNFVVVPLSFLSGTFYSIERLPEQLRFVAHLNPFFYAIDGFRAGFTGRSDADVLLGAAVLLAVNVALFVACLRLFQSGYKLKA